MSKRSGLLLASFCAVMFLICVTAEASPGFAAVSFPLGEYTVGEFAIVFDEKGQFRVSKGGEMAVEGEYTVKSDQLELTDKRGPFSCAGAGHETGIYKWKYEGEILTLSKVADECDGRSAAMTAQPWKRKKSE